MGLLALGRGGHFIKNSFSAIFFNSRKKVLNFWRLNLQKFTSFILMPSLCYIVQREKGVDKTLAKALPMAKPGSWGCVQCHDLW